MSDLEYQIAYLTRAKRRWKTLAIVMCVAISLFAVASFVRAKAMQAKAQQMRAEALRAAATVAELHREKAAQP